MNKPNSLPLWESLVLFGWEAMICTMEVQSSERCLGAASCNGFTSVRSFTFYTFPEELPGSVYILKRDGSPTKCGVSTCVRIFFFF